MPLKVINSIEEVMPGMCIYDELLGIGKVISTRSGLIQVLFLFHARIYDIKLASNVYLVDMRDVVVNIGGIESRPQGSFF